MQKFYKWFNILLNLLLISPFLAAMVFIYLGMNNYTFPGNSLATKGAVITILMLTVFISGLLFILFGFSIFIVNRKKNPERAKLGKRVLINGIVKSVLSFVIFFLLSLALSFFGLSEPSCLCLPKLPDPNTPGFPVEELTITDRKTITPKISGDFWECAVTIHNTNTEKIATWLTFKNAEEDGSNDAILPGESKVITIYDDDNSQNPCNNITITKAEIAPKDSVVQDEISPTPPPSFPVADLTITYRKPVAPESASGLWACDLTIYNSNTTQSAQNLTFTNADEGYLPYGDTITSGKMATIQVVSNTNGSGDICPTVAIESAEVVSNGN